jgi:hypothetical protein
MTAGLSWAQRFEPPPPKDRCDGSGQLTMTVDGRRVPCPVCGAAIATVDAGGRPVIVDHAPRRNDAQPIGLGL